ncbi:class I SAM-dependent methyltransferase [Streptomyces sp. NE06-03E]|uniref:Class I SAM-dependent methyltransferase n=1 Tax=Streptomyces silvae TaxID=2803812 RepID=A0ABU8A8B7_9ACTN|nr:MULTISPECIES: class I SAM-dependent methyltransferase [unclassified Streptomyces]WSS71172.1 class I SAM-dependent methyltransferase [Streptomyces sp. NBC_01175]MDX3060008.1 class I SAM-dependent methyltransferase [Streptomyces sp. NE06-03E]MDX3325353.1 class I SAM-dependent methyltransferase [Streptomyces sp. ME02-6979-3A]MDX3430917.1 class I SAM-dependent methyltransferase [Streptomyces sp. ME01-18a]MDX3682921.1 class I SAM-dependent methyltransferase [Streptomyces sp. AK04-4c]
MAEAATGTDWQSWQQSWDRQQEWYMPDREERFRVMLDMVEAVVGPEPRVLDLACGTGSITDRLLARFPGATSTGVDLDPALLTIARGTFEGDGRATFVTADLKDPAWTERLPHTSYDAVLTATALHWLHSEPLATLYGQVAGVVRDGGVFMNADHMIDTATPRINAAERAHRHAAMDRAKAAGAVDWREWWDLMAKDPVLAEPTAERFAIYGEHADGDMPSADWHARTLREAGFGEARAVWASPSDTMVLALK